MKAVVLLFLVSGLFGQTLKPAAPAVAATDSTNYLLPIELQKTFRDGQLEWDELEIDNQKMLVKIEQNHQRQAAIMDEQRKRAYQFALDKKIDLGLYELDSKDLKFEKKKKP
jgi:hypothetical protein